MRGGEAMINSKIDRGFVNSPWKGLWPNNQLNYHPCGMSNHLLLMIELRHVQDNRNKPFEFTNFWLRSPELWDLVDGAWRKLVNQGSEMFMFTMRLRNVKRVHRNWARNYINNPSELKKP